MRKILLIPVLLLIAFIMVTARAGASPAIFPAPTLSAGTLAALAPAGKRIASPASFSTHTNAVLSTSYATSEDLIPGTQPVEDLVAISWNEIVIPGDQTFLSDLFDLPSYNETWTQVIARENLANHSADVQTDNSMAHPADCQAETFCVAGVHLVENKDCLACHAASPAGLTVSSHNISQPVVHVQMASIQILDCEFCHIQRFERDLLQISGAD